MKTLIIKEQYILNETNRLAKALIPGVEYRVSDNVKARTEFGLEGWCVISGQYLEHTGNVNSYSVTFTDTEMKEINKLSI
jgi:hypothetical protein